MKYFLTGVLITTSILGSVYADVCEFKPWEACSLQFMQQSKNPDEQCSRFKDAADCLTDILNECDMDEDDKSPLKRRIVSLEKAARNCLEEHHLITWNKRVVKRARKRGPDREGRARKRGVDREERARKRDARARKRDARARKRDSRARKRDARARKRDLNRQERGEKQEHFNAMLG